MRLKKRAFWGGGAACFVLLFVWEQIQSVRLGYSLDSARHQVDAQRCRNAYLRLNLERESSPEWVAMTAKSRLGMQPPLPEKLVLLDKTG